LKVKLKPLELGEITIKLTLEKGIISGTITAEKKEVYNMIQNQIDVIKGEIKNANINLNNLSVNISSSNQDNNGHSRGSYGEQRRQQQNPNVFKEESEKKEVKDGFNIMA
jgi:flagellar hook-length control protein FliK